MPSALLQTGVSISQLLIWAEWFKNLLKAFSPSALRLEQPANPRTVGKAVGKALGQWTPLILMENSIDCDGATLTDTTQGICLKWEVDLIYIFFSLFLRELRGLYILVSPEMCKFVESFWWHREQQGCNLALWNFEAGKWETERFYFPFRGM